MQGCGCLLVIVTGVMGLFFWPLWLLTIAGVIMAVSGGKKK
jgi:hypothetical protein